MIGMQHGRDWGGENITGWIVTEKIEGIRLLWDGDRAWSKEGNEIALTPAFRASLPRGFCLEGELHCGRGGFRRALSLFKSGLVDDRLVFTIFDAPREPGGWLARVATLPHCAHEVVAHEICTGVGPVLRQLAAVQCAGGEGLMVRDPELCYTPGRTRRLLKIKSCPPQMADAFADFCHALA